MGASQIDRVTAEASSVPESEDGERQTLKSRVLETLVDEIMNGVLLPGQKLSEYRLAQRFGVSRMPVREALIELNRRGMVRVVPQVGTFVTEMTAEEISHQFEVREALEVQAARLSAERATEADLQKLEAIIEAMGDAANDGSARRYVALDESFHATIFQSTSNPALIEHYKALMNSLHREYLSLVVSATHGRMERSLLEHRQVLKGLRASNLDAAETAMREHVQRGKAELEEAIEQRSTSSKQEY